MSIKFDKYTNLIKEQIKNYSKNIELSNIGYVISVGDSIAQVSNLKDAISNEILLFENGTLGIIFNLEANSVGVILLGRFDDIKENSVVKRTNKIMEIPVGDELLGRVVDPLGNPLDNKGKINNKIWYPIERSAPGVMTRQSVCEPLETGIIAIDSMFPIGKGQRELIIGDRQIGKTSIAIDTIINQKGKNVKCVYVAIGQKNSNIALIKKTLEEHGALDYTTIICSSASDLPAIKYIAPFSGTSIAEYWMEKGDDVLIIYDDLTKHAIAYRTLSLLLRRPPGREAFPGDVFYLHSRLLERSAKLNKNHGGGSLTALPIIETQQGDISAYIPTNVISITDGQLFLTTSLFNSRQRPAIDTGLSVSRVGSAAQRDWIKKFSGTLKLDLAQYKELEAFSRFGSDVDEDTRAMLEHGKKVLECLKQPIFSPYDQVNEMIILFTIKNKYIQYIPVEFIKSFIPFLINNFKNSKIYSHIKNSNKFKNEWNNELSKIIIESIKSFVIKINNYDWNSYPELKEL